MRRFIIWLLLAVAAPAATAQPWAARIARIERIEPFASAFVSARQLHQALTAKGWTVGYQEASGGHHNEAAWAQRVAAMLRHIHGLPVSAR